MQLNDGRPERLVSVTRFVAAGKLRVLKGGQLALSYEGLNPKAAVSLYIKDVAMTQPLFKLPNSRVSDTTRECAVHKDQRSIQGGCEIRPSVWICAECWQAKLGIIKGRRSQSSK